MKRFAVKFGVMVALLAVSAWFPAMRAAAADGIKYRCSHQAFNAFEKDNLEGFAKDTGIRVDVKAYPSDVAVNLLVNGYCDLASTARQLDARHTESGFKQTPICSDPMAVIANTRCGIANVTEKQLEDIFSGEITNWKEAGGPDLPVIVVVPAENTAASRNFRRFVMKHKEIKYSIMTADAELAMDTVAYLPMGAVSFVSRGAALRHKDLKFLTVDGVSVDDAGYPFIQTFYYVTKGEPAGLVKKYIDYTFSEKGMERIRKNGMIPAK